MAGGAEWGGDYFHLQDDVAVLDAGDDGDAVDKVDDGRVRADDPGGERA